MTDLRPFTLEWEDDETCQIARDGNYISCEEAVDILNELIEKVKRIKFENNLIKNEIHRQRDTVMERYKTNRRDDSAQYGALALTHLMNTLIMQDLW